MFTPQKRCGASTFSPSRAIPLNGLFTDSVWHCNCNPRLPASHFQVRKQGPNHGKWFYTCQEPKESACGFFLWGDAAIGREMRAVIGNTRSEPDPLKNTASDSPGRESTSRPRTGSGKQWIQDLGKESDDEFEDWPLTQEGEKKAMDIIKSPQPSLPETPRKAAKISPYMTPTSKRKRAEDSLVTPATNNKDDVFGTPSTVRRTGTEPLGLRSPAQTPTPGRFHDADAPDARGDPSQNYDVTEEVLALLKDQQIDDGTVAELQRLLNKQALRVSGIAKGRDITRVALKAKDARIAELQQRISALEMEREMDKTVIRHFKSDMAHSVASRGGRGRGRGRG